MAGKTVEDEERLEILRGRITLAVEAVKSLALVNGGAAVAVLTFLGHLGEDRARSVNPGLIPLAILSFALGLAAAMLTAIYAYVAQAYLHQEVLGTRKVGEHDRQIRRGVGLALASAALFFIGCVLGVAALTFAA